MYNSVYENTPTFASETREDGSDQGAEKKENNK